MAKLKNDSTMFYRYCWEFLHVYLPERMGRSQYTVESYIDSLTIFKNFLVEIKHIKIESFKFTDCTIELLFQFMDWLSNNGNTNSTINHRITGIRGYVYFATTKDVSLNFLYSQLCKIKPLKSKKLEKETVSEKQLALILKQAEDNEKGIRNRVMLLTLYETAMRVSELSSLTLSCLMINRDSPFITVHGKGNKERHIPISDKLAKILSKYIEQYKDSNSTWLFSSFHRGEQLPLSQRSIQDILSRYSVKARSIDSSIPIKVHPHMLRRSRATDLYQHGLAIELVSSLLGHEHISTSLIYAKPSIAQLRKEIEKSIPEDAYKQQPKWKKDKNFIKSLGLR